MMPVASKAIADNYGLEISPATIRNDIAYLEQEGYVTRPHSSSGCIPTDKAYRHYVELIGENIELPLVEQYLIRELFREARKEIEQSLREAAVWLSHFVHNMAIITSPKPNQHRLKHIELIALQDFVALFILVLYRAKVRQQILTFDRKVTQDELTSLTNKLNARYSGMTEGEISASKSGFFPEEEQATECLIEMMAAEDKMEHGKAYLEGLRLMLSQPEFVSGPRMLDILGVLERENWLGDVLCLDLSDDVRVIIGKENSEEALQDLSLIVSQYGLPYKARGIIGVIGPKRMNYAKAISSVNCLSSVLSKSTAGYM